MRLSEFRKNMKEIIIFYFIKISKSKLVYFIYYFIIYSIMI